MAPPALRLDAAIRVEGLVADPDRIFVFLGSRQHIPPHETGKGHIAAELRLIERGAVRLKVHQKAGLLFPPVLVVLSASPDGLFVVSFADFKVSGFCLDFTAFVRVYPDCNCSAWFSLWWGGDWLFSCLCVFCAFATYVVVCLCVM